MINPNNAPLSVFTFVPGWETPHEQGLLLSLASGFISNDPAYSITIVEIGSELGMSASLFCLAAQYEPNVDIICIDINKDAPFEANIKESGLEYQATLHTVYQDSKLIEFDTLIQDLMLNGEYISNLISLLFIDGDHSYDGALADLTNFTPHVAIGGIVAIHDCAVKTNIHPHQLHYEVYNAVHKWLAGNGSRDGFRFMFSVDSTMVFRRMK